MREYAALHEHQRLMAQWIIEKPRCGLFVPMGMGKTAATLTALEALQLVEDIGKVLILAPKRVATHTWSSEIAEWAHLQGLTISVVTGSEAQRRTALRKDADIYTTNYENLIWLEKEIANRSRREYEWPFKTVIVDESTRLKNFRLRQGTKSARPLARAYDLINRLVILTGTPSPNGLKDLWGQVWFLDKGERLGRAYHAFEQRWFTKGYDGYSLTPRPEAQEEIMKALSDICFSMKVEDYFDLDKPIVSEVEVPLPDSVKEMYKQLETQLYSELLEKEHNVQITSFASGTSMMKCMQLANGAVYTDEAGSFTEIHDAKIEALRSIIEESAGQNILVAYNFKSDLARLRKAFPQGKALTDGDDIIEKWNKGKIPLMFIHPASGGHGLSLQHGGSIIVFFSCGWNLEHHDQVIERIGPTRQKQSGYNRPVFIYYLMAEGTIDYKILKRMRTKAKIQDILMEGLRMRGYM